MRLLSSFNKFVVRAKMNNKNEGKNKLHISNIKKKTRPLSEYMKDEEILRDE